MAHRGILVDVTKCIGCGACVEACQKANGQPPHEARGLDAQTYTYLMDRGNDRYVRRLCMHCEDPSCASACPVAAMHKTPEGPVVYDADRCLGCRYCLLACPFGVPTYEWHSAAPRVQKCQMCYTRGAAGPACAEACPSGATKTGDRDALIKEARQRLASDPKTYFDHIYGINAAGGTDVLFIGPKDPQAMGLPRVARNLPMPDLTWQALRHVPDVVLYGGVLLGGLYWITKRKEDVARAEREEKGEHHA